MSVAFTEQAVRDRTKTVTRRKGWLFAKPGDRVTLCRKVIGRKPGQRALERICDVETVSVRREPLGAITLDDAARKGFPAWGEGKAPTSGTQSSARSSVSGGGAGGGSCPATDSRVSRVVNAD